MSTSAIKKRRIVYLGATVFTLAFGLIYEMFSYGVYSAYMVFAFLIPLCGFIVSEFLRLIFKKYDKGRADEKAVYKTPLLQKDLRAPFAYQLLSGAVIWLTLGFVYAGVLEIYGTTNKLMGVYWVIGILQVIAALTAAFLRITNKKVSSGN
ncbi:MAG: hypothetical protein K6B75_01565 [Lachnospiraceae bacterium]|nr:hypothetical protein [Lachnospiraceae bacterium]